MGKLFSPYRIRFVYDMWGKDRPFNKKERKTRSAIMDMLNSANHEIMMQNYLSADTIRRTAQALITCYELPFIIEDTRKRKEKPVCRNFGGGICCYKCDNDPNVCDKNSCKKAVDCGNCGKFYSDECKPEFVTDKYEPEFI